MKQARLFHLTLRTMHKTLLFINRNVLPHVISDWRCRDFVESLGDHVQDLPPSLYAQRFLPTALVFVARGFCSFSPAYTYGLLLHSEIIFALMLVLLKYL